MGPPNNLPKEANSIMILHIKTLILAHLIMDEKNRKGYNCYIKFKIY